MQFKEGTEVFTADGEKAGEIERVVIDPLTEKVTHIVVRKGFLFPEDKVVPVNLVQKATEERVALRVIEDLDTLPPLREEHYVPYYEVEQDQYDHPYYWYPPQGVPWWQPMGYLNYPSAFGYVEPPYVIEREENFPEGTVPLKEGARVIASDGDRVGDVQQVLTAPDTDRVTHFVVSRGFLLTEEKLVPTTWVKIVTENEVRLAVSSAQVDSLPAYEA